MGKATAGKCNNRSVITINGRRDQMGFDAENTHIVTMAAGLEQAQQCVEFEMNITEAHNVN